MAIRIPEDTWVFGEGDEPVEREVYTLAEAINDNPWADWNYWIGLPRWTPEEAAMLFLHCDPHLKQNDVERTRAFKQAMQALKLHGFTVDKKPGEWAAVFKSLPCFRGVFDVSQSHPFCYMIDEQPEAGEALPCSTELEIKPTSDSLDPRQRNTYLKVIAAALCPRGDTSPIEERGQAGILTRRLAELGLSVSEQAVKKTLKEVAEFVRENNEKTL